MNTLICPAPAKLNLFLHVVGRRDDGYHLLQTLFRFIDLNDTLHFTLRDDGQVCRLNALEGVPPEQDLCVRAARLLQQESGCKLGVDIEVEKRIPMGGGLGGGSSDAATTLLALNKLWGLGLNRERLMAMGLTLGLVTDRLVGLLGIADAQEHAHPDARRTVVHEALRQPRALHGVGIGGVGRQPQRRREHAHARE